MKKKVKVDSDERKQNKTEWREERLLRGRKKEPTRIQIEREVRGKSAK